MDHDGLDMVSRISQRLSQLPAGDRLAMMVMFV